MAYRRRQGISRASTFKEEIHEQPSLLDSDENATNVNDLSHAPRLSSSYSFTPTSSSSSSLAAQAIKASAARRDPNLSFPFTKSSLAPEHEHHRSKSLDSYGDASKSGFWGVLAQKAKDILEDDNQSLQHDKLISHSFNTFTPGARTQEGRTVGDSRLKGSSPEDSNQGSGIWNPWQQSAQTQNSQSNIHETQLKASRDVAMATAAKAKLLLRELKTVKADLAFSKARCAQLEEENKLLRDREGREKGQNRADDDLIRLQLETLLAEKARLASENEVYSRENRFLREIVEYHQLTMQDVVYLDEGMEEVAELYPIDATGTTVPRVLSASSPRSPLASRAMQTKPIFSVPQQQEDDNNYTLEDEAPPSPSISLSVSKD